MSSAAKAPSTTAPQAVTDRRIIDVAYILLAIGGLLGLSAGVYPFTVDFPNHAARLFIECNLGDPVLSRMYSVEYELIPNLAIDLINRPLCGVLDPMTVIRGTMVVTMAGILMVTWKLHRLLVGEPNAFVLLAPAMTFNIVTGMGYLNYLIGTFLFLLFIWFMLRFRVLEWPPRLAILLPNLFGVLLFLCHIFALGLAGVFLFGLRFASGRGKPFSRRALSAGLMTALSFAVPLLMMLLAERSGFGITYQLAGKIRTLWAPMLYSSVFAAAFLAFVWIALFLWAFREKHVTIAAAMRWPLLFLAIFAFSLPNALLDAVDLDSRSLVAVAYLAIASIGPRGDDAGREGIPFRAEVASAIVAAATIVVQLSVSLPKMSLYDRQVAELRDALKVIGPLDTVITFADTERETTVPLQHYSHLASYATWDRKAFNPFEFTGKGMQPLRATPAFACIDVPAGRPLGLQIARQLLDPATVPLLKQSRYANIRYAYRWDRKFDYVIFYHFGSRSNPFPNMLEPVHVGTFFSLLRAQHPRASVPLC